MFKTKIAPYLLLVLVCTPLVVCGRDILLEFKAAAFFPTDDCFKNIYGKAGALYGPELSVQLYDENECWYAFASVDHFSKDGCSIGLNTPTELSLVPIAFGLKYFIRSCCGDFYAGLGFQPVHMSVTNCSTNVVQCTEKWAFGGIAKIGALFDLRCNFFLDIFCDYSFAQASCQTQCVDSPLVIATQAKLSGVVLGAGLGYRF